MGEKQFDVVALGELLIDFTENGTSNQGNQLFEANPGGAPCNVLAMLTKLGKKTAFIGKVGNDMFGRRLKDSLEEVGIDTRNLVMDEEIHTTLAFVHTFEDGDRDFSFYRNPGADMMLTKEEVQDELIKASRIFHFGTLSSTHEGVREATRHAIQVAKENGLIITFDPNLREPLWKDLNDAKAEIEYGMAQCDVLKISDNEVEFLWNCTPEEGADKLLSEFGVSLAMVTLGPDGCLLKTKNASFRAACPKVHPIDTTGAGDIFGGSAVSRLLELEKPIDALTEADLAYIGCFAATAASLSTEASGGIPSIPEKEAVLNAM